MENGHWDNRVRLNVASECSGIGATAWNSTSDYGADARLYEPAHHVLPDLDEIRLYYQDKDFNIREYCGNFGGKW